MSRSDREILEDVVRVIAEQAADWDRIVEEALEAGLGADDRVVYTKMLRLELLNTKAAFERQLELLVLDCSECGQRVHYVSGPGIPLDTDCALRGGAMSNLEDDFGEQIARARTASHRHRVAIASIESGETLLSDREAVDAEIERLAARVEPYLDAYREWLEARSLFRVLNKTDIDPLAGHSPGSPDQLRLRSTNAELLEDAKAREEAGRAKADVLYEENRSDVDRLRLLLKLRPTLD